MKKKKRQKPRKSKKRDREILALLNILDDSIIFLSKKFRIRGKDSRDIRQLLCQKVIEEYQDNRDKGKGWWFLRLKWHMFNLLKKADRDPLTRGISIDAYLADYKKASNR